MAKTTKLSFADCSFGSGFSNTNSGYGGYTISTIIFSQIAPILSSAASGALGNLGTIRNGLIIGGYDSNPILEFFDPVSLTGKILTWNKDYDGNEYNVIRIGTQLWTDENLKTTKYITGASVPLVTGDAAWSALSTAVLLV
jgi:hypothetical protein